MSKMKIIGKDDTTLVYEYNGIRYLTSFRVFDLDSYSVYYVELLTELNYYLDEIVDDPQELSNNYLFQNKQELIEINGTDVQMLKMYLKNPDDYEYSINTTTNRIYLHYDILKEEDKISIELINEFNDNPISTKTISTTREHDL